MMHQRIIKELENMPNKVPTESDDQRKARLSVQEIGSREGTHAKVVAAQEADSRLRNRIAAKKETKS